jgi:hypothetical protein
MPFIWHIAHEEHLVRATAEGVLTLPDIQAYLDDVVINDAGSYAKLIDMGDAKVQASDHDMMLLGARMRAYFESAPAGPVAFVVTNPANVEYVVRFINLSSGPRPAEIFATAAEAKAWLADQKE